MHNLHLPARHDAGDLEVAAVLARTLRSAELYVTWSAAGGVARPVVAARAEEACAPRVRRGGLLGRLDPRRRLL